MMDVEYDFLTYDLSLFSVLVDMHADITCFQGMLHLKSKVARGNVHGEVCKSVRGRYSLYPLTP